jgi:rSAM/selenodomain-associated transferase 1
MSVDSALLVFVRAPELGRVKTRLAAELGAPLALAVHRYLGSRIADEVRRLQHHRVIVYYTGSDGAASVGAWLGDEFPLRPQVDGNLGERMSAAIGATLADGVSRVVIVGTDCPSLDSAAIETAFRALDSADVVLGPAADGGYYLIGMCRLYPSLFENVPWSSPETLRVTLEGARELGLSVAMLEERRDVDTADDWRDWLARQAAPRSQPRSAIETWGTGESPHGS